MIPTMRDPVSVGVAAGANTTEPIAEEGWSSRCLSSRPSAGMLRNRAEEPNVAYIAHGQSNRIARSEETKSRWRLDRRGVFHERGETPVRTVPNQQSPRSRVKNPPCTEPHCLRSCYFESFMCFRPPSKRSSASSERSSMLKLFGFDN